MEIALFADSFAGFGSKRFIQHQAIEEKGGLTGAGFLDPAAGVLGSIALSLGSHAPGVT